MTDAVIVALGRSPIGRAQKGSLVDVRPDDLAAHVICRVLDKVPSLPAEQIEDLMCGTASPAGEQGHNLARVLGILTRLNTPGTTVNRYCSSSLQTTRMAAHAIWAGEGHAFLSVGVEGVSRYVNGSANTREGANQRLLPSNPDVFPDTYIAIVLTAENVARQEGVP